MSVLTVTTTISRQLVRATLVPALAFGALLGVLLGVQLVQLADQHRTAVGDALLTSLLDAVRQPLTERDAVRLQVTLDGLISHHPALAQITVTDAEGRQHTRKGSVWVEGSDLLSFAGKVALIDGGSGNVRIDLIGSALASGYQAPLWNAVALWFAATTGFMVWIAHFGRRLDHRLAQLNLGLPSAEDEAGLDQLSVLERRVAPLLMHATASLTPSPSVTADGVSDGCTLAVHCLNLQRLKSHLNHDSFRHRLDSLDKLLEMALHLYGGHRESGAGAWVYAHFTTDNREDAALRALSCAHALCVLAREQKFLEGMDSELTAVLAPRPTSTQGSRWLWEYLSDEHRHDLRKAAEGAARSQILLTAALAQRLAGAANTTPIADGEHALLFNGFADARRALADQQVAYLRTRLRD